MKSKVLMNDTVQKITTPYMRFYELAALAEIGQQAYVTIKVTAVDGQGTLRFRSAKRPTSKNGTISNIGENMYEMPLKNGEACSVEYSALE